MIYSKYVEESRADLLKYAENFIIILTDRRTRRIMPRVNFLASSICLRSIALRTYLRPS